jgi:hypothetical protein
MRQNRQVDSTEEAPNVGPPPKAKDFLLQAQSGGRLRMSGNPARDGSIARHKWWIIVSIKTTHNM